MINPISKQNKYQVVLSDNEDIDVVMLDESKVSNLEVNSTYEFTFKAYQSYIDTDIEDVFKENEIIDIKKTDKVGIEQIQDSSCRFFY